MCLLLFVIQYSVQIVKYVKAVTYGVINWFYLI